MASGLLWMIGFGLLGNLGCATEPAQALPDLAQVVTPSESQSEWPEGQVLVISGPARVSGVEGSFQLELFGPGRYRLELNGASRRVSASDGSAAWVQTDGGPARRLVLLERDSMALLIQAINGDWSRTTTDLTRRVTDVGPDLVVLAVDFPGAAPALRLEVQRSSGEARAFSSDNRGRTSRWQLEGWRELEGRRLPSRIEFVGSEYTGSRLDLQAAHWEPADPSRLTRPIGARDARFIEGVSEEVSARRAGTGHLFVPVSFDGGAEHWFLLDTGASGIVIDDDLARSMTMESVGVVGAIGGTGRKLARLSRGPSLRVGPLEIDNPSLLTLDLDGLAVHLGTDVEGILGCDLFSRAAVALPARNSPAVVRIRPPGGFDAEGIDWVPALANDSVVAIRGLVESERRGWFLLDTGAAWAAALHGPWLASLGLPDERPATEGMTRGIVSRGKTLVVTLSELAFAGQTIEDVQTHLALVRDGSLADRVLMGNIGIDALAPFGVLIDLANERLALQPETGVPSPGQR